MGGRALSRFDSNNLAVEVSESGISDDLFYFVGTHQGSSSIQCKQYLDLLSYHHKRPSV